MKGERKNVVQFMISLRTNLYMDQMHPCSLQAGFALILLDDYLSLGTLI
jgi:hypothetical protein